MSALQALEDALNKFKNSRKHRYVLLNYGEVIGVFSFKSKMKKKAKDFVKENKSSTPVLEYETWESNSGIRIDHNFLYICKSLARQNAFIDAMKISYDYFPDKKDFGKFLI